jgi:hypothetical protein
MYDAVLARRDVSNGAVGALRADLSRFRDDELRHAGALGEAMLDLGAEPPALASDVDTLARVQQLTDSRTSLGQVLRILLEAEVADIDGWESLVVAARTLGYPDLARSARRAALEEELHIVHVRHWMAEIALSTGA